MSTLMREPGPKNRTRKHMVSLYLSGTEKDQLVRLGQHRGLNHNELLRKMIDRAARQLPTSPPSPGKETV
jgi:hypothetical protein